MTTTLTTDSGARLPGLIRRLTGDEKHAPSAHSTLDVLWVLYDRVLRVTPDTVDDPDRDRFLLSKGHGPAAYYAVLAAQGLHPGRLARRPGRPGEPARPPPGPARWCPGVEIGSGSLGHGLGLAVGTALGLRAQGLLDPRVYVLLGDAELDEGSNHEAIAYAGATGLDSLTAVVVDNSSATHGWAGGIASRFTVNGWTADTVDGRDHEALYAALTGHRPRHAAPGGRRVTESKG